MTTSGLRLARACALASTSTVALLTGALMSAPAFAQTAQAPSIDEIVVTGSRVIRDGYEAPTPVSVLGADELNAMNDASIADSVNKLPAFSGSQTQRTGAVNVSSGSAGVNILNLRGMGGHRVLILLDGKRVINSSLSAGYTGGDTNTMPQGLISRVDVSTGGASAAYGSDALSGVVNFVLDKEFTGVKGEVQGGLSTYGDDPNAQVNLSYGTPFANGRGHVLVFGEYAWNKGIKGAHRPWNEFGGVVMSNPLRTATNGLPAFIAQDHIGVNNAMPGGLITRGPLKGLYFGPNGSVAQFNYGLVGNSNLMQGGDWKISRVDQDLDLDPRAVRENVFSRVSYDVSDNVTVFAEGHWAYAHAENNNNVNRLFDQVTILSGNPYIPASVQAQMTTLGLTNIVLGSSTGDVGRFYADNSRNVRRWSVGADGRFDAFGTEWTWDAYYQFTQQGLSSRVRNSGHTPRINAATNAVRNPATGSIVCAVNIDANPANDMPGCVPFNFFGVGVNSQAAIDWFVGSAYRYDSMRQKIASATLNGEPFDTWAGPVSIATGIEHRTESVNGLNSADDEAGNFLAGNFKLNIGKLNVTEGFLETVVPLAKDVAWARALDLSAAVRATDYSSSGYVTTWKGGATWQVIDDVRFRVTRSRDIRAANLGELYAGGTASGSSTFNDPFTGTQVPQAFSQSKGNPLLKPERADTTGVGVVLTPTFFEGFATSVDYYNIDVKGAVATPSGQSLVDGCFAGNQAFCPSIIRVPDPNTPGNLGRIQTVITSPQNIASEKVSGIDLESSYRFAMSDVLDAMDGDLSLRFLANFVLKTQSFNPTLSANQFVDGKGVLGGFAVSGYSGRTNPNYKLNGSIRYSTDAYSVNMTVRHTSSGVYNNAFTACTTACPANDTRTIDNNHIASDTVVDIGFNYRPIQDSANVELFLSVQNLLNSPPPFIAGGNGGSYYSGQNVRDYDTIGRFFTTGVRFKM
ncbi:MAG: TonB-dependent receptor [Rhodospirillaceae bacterium]|nr:TonB-dependent receptor [Rhodospirillaceae bacterium]